MSASIYRTVGELSVNLDSRRKPVRSADRRGGPFPYYGASGVVDHVDDFIFEGLHVLVAEDGENLRSRNTPVAFLADGKFWVNNHAHVLVANESANTRYLAYAIENTDISGFLTGSTQPKLTKAALAQIQIFAPPAAEQRAIAEVLGALDDKIAANTSQIRTLDEYGTTLVAGAVSSERIQLSAVAQIVMGTSPKGADLNEKGAGLPFYQGTRDFGVRSPTRRVYTTNTVRRAAEGDILLSVRAPVGEVNVATEEVAIGRGVAAVRSTVGTPWTLFHLLRTDRAAWEPFNSEGTVFGSINRDQLAKLPLLAIPSETAMAVEDSVRPSEELIANLVAENARLAATRDALLPQLMSGKLRVRDAERVASDAGA